MSSNLQKALFYLDLMHHYLDVGLLGESERYAAKARELLNGQNT